MINSEAHRQFYLAAAGVRMWYAKRPLPGAAPSHEFELQDSAPLEARSFTDDVPAARSSGVGVRPSQKPPRNRSVDLQSLMAPAGDQAVNAKRPEPSVSIEAGSRDAIASEIEPVEEPASPVRAPDPLGDSSEEGSVEVSSRPAIAAHLSIWSTASYVLISQWSEEASERLQDSLARNLLKALHPSEVGERRMLHWPVFRNPHIPGNSMEDFRDVLGRMVPPEPDRSILLLGVLSGEQDEHRQRCLMPLLPQVGVDFPFSLAELSATSAHKRDLWSALKTRYSV